MVLTGTPYHTSTARGQASAAHDEFSKIDIENAMSFMSSVMAPRAHAHIFCSDRLSFRYNKGLFARVEIVEDVEADPEEAKERTLYMFEVEDQALACTKSLGVCSRNPRHKNLFHGSGSERAVHF